MPQEHPTPIPVIPGDRRPRMIASDRVGWLTGNPVFSFPLTTLHIHMGHDYIPTSPVGYPHTPKPASNGKLASRPQMRKHLPRQGISDNPLLVIPAPGWISRNPALLNHPSDPSSHSPSSCQLVQSVDDPPHSPSLHHGRKGQALRRTQGPGPPHPQIQRKSAPLRTHEHLTHAQARILRNHGIPHRP